MRRNVIILTCGQSGSSVLTALIARAGYWVGDETKRVWYDTYENAELVDIDRELLKFVEYNWDRHDSHLGPPPLERMKAAVESFDAGAARALLAKCEAHRPWIWKDPRLAFTIHYWESFLDLSNCSFIVMGRDLRQAWTAHILKGFAPMSFQDYRHTHRELLDVGEAFPRDRNLPYLRTTFEELVLEPQRVLDEVNGLLGTSLTVDDLRAVYQGPLGKIRWSQVDHVHAWARYQALRLLIGTGLRRRS